MLEVSVDDILLQVYNNAHIYTHTHIDTHTNPPTHLHKVLPTIYFSCHLVISNYYKSYQYKYIYVYVYIYIYIYMKNSIPKSALRKGGIRGSKEN